ncbi:hypothetical protein FHR83_006351 [Actinoplanes campanulatus]|uniref:Uncharacterized protein n=1 Tax=Actinoplanes campanulatus TaxID=113559 RepID=A0A7W5FHN7_9ACTN|nr:hypothetical protein [Actinoplanes campanulatus]MBB3098652.1 hypothetical protein [Actinoplanes campanulatus]GGN36333.1 hypothetical protein GCM10010109_61190 [Actinoplanes campanulatus]GID39342.1 hypothetical protein Aca09nite_58480 [Actinoplanes campanulatus]
MIRSSLPAGDIVETMVRFEERYGGLAYTVRGGNDMEYGLDGPPSVHATPLGPAFDGILDGDWTWGLSVLADGRTAMGPGRWPFRVIDRSVDQRLERHALMAEIHGWFHRTFECRTPAHVPPVADESVLPPPVPEATGPAEWWWCSEDVAVQATLSGWPPDRDRWTVRYFARTPQQAAEANPTIYAATVHETVPAALCTLCCQAIEPGRTCAR